MVGCLPSPVELAVADAYWPTQEASLTEVSRDGAGECFRALCSEPLS